MLTALLAYRLAKYLGIGLFAGGLGLAVSTASPRTRLVGGLLLATLGLIATWMGGYGWMKLLGQSFREPHIAGALFASLAALLGGVLGGLLASRAAPLALAVGGFAASVGFMTSGPAADPLTLVVAGGLVPVVLAVGAAVAGSRMGPAPVAPETSKVAVKHWFAWIARAEGISLLVLFGLYMPLKYGAHIEIDGGDGWIGWAHGVLVFLYLLALGTGLVVARWGILAGVLGFVASLLPFGTFAFEWWLGRRERATQA